MTLIATTSRLEIRSWEVSDVYRLCALTREPGLSEFSISGYKDFSEEHARHWIESEAQRFKSSRLGKFAVVLKDSAQLIGISGLFQMPVENQGDLESCDVELNYRFPVARRGQGFGIEAASAIVNYGFHTLALTEINGIVEGHNFPSKKILDRLGMKRKGTLLFKGMSFEHWHICRKHEAL